MGAAPASSARTLVVDPEPLFAQGVVAALTGLVSPEPVLAEWSAPVPWPGPGGAAIVGVRRTVPADADVVRAALRSQTPVIMVGAPGTARAVTELQTAGVCHILTRECRGADLLSALMAVRRQQPAPHPRVATDPAGPTRRELEVVTLLAKGLSNREIAGHLFISEHTVRNHLGHVFAKLGASSRTQAVVKAGEVGWLRLPG